MAAMVDIRLLGRFSARRDEEEIPPGAFGGGLVRALVRVLVTRRGTFVSRDVLAEALWPGRMPADPAANLRVLVQRARAALGDPAALGDEAWDHLLRWHDHTLRSLFARHGGEEVNRIGDGFFVAFDRPEPAVR
jgi:class 3 adenylate cyclase